MTNTNKTVASECLIFVFICAEKQLDFKHNTLGNLKFYWEYIFTQNKNMLILRNIRTKSTQ